MTLYVKSTVSNITQWLHTNARFVTVSLWLSFGCASEEIPADIILYNGKIITVDSAFSVQQAVAIRDGRIIGVGSSEDVMEKAGDSTMLVPLRGRTVVPGLIEGHAHPVVASQSEYLDPIPVANSIEEVLQWIRQEAREKKNGEWIVHPKFFITRMKEMRQISIQELDAAAPNNPVFLNGSYGGIINTKALQVSKLAGLKHPGILRDENTRQPTGLIRRSAFDLLAIPPSKPISEEQKLLLLKELLHRYNSIGFTSVCSGGGTDDELKIFRELRERNELTVRIFHNMRIPLDTDKSQNEIASLLRESGIKTGDGDEWVKVGAFKVVLDGGMLTGTAFLNEGWGEKAKGIYGINDPAYRGELMFSKGQLVKLISAAAESDWKFTAHVTGGGGVDTLLAAYEMVNARLPLKGKRFSIIHGNFFTPEAIAKMSGLGIYADMQPAWFYKDTDLLNHVLGRERIRTFHPYRSLINAGIVINAGSDHMVKVDPDSSINPYNPFIAMWSVVTRRTERGTVFNPEQAISREDALRMYTINNARASFEEDYKGSIEEGKFADLVILSDDILTCNEDKIRNIRPILTMVNGMIVFNSGEINVSDQKK